MSTFDIPDPFSSYENGVSGDTEQQQHQEKVLCKFRKKYRKPVQFQ